MTRLRRCPHPDCHELIPINEPACGAHADPARFGKCSIPGCKELAVRGRLKLCIRHREERRDATISAANAKTTLKRREARQNAPRKDREIKPQSQVKIPEVAVIQPHRPPKVERVKPEPIMTDAEQSALEDKARESEGQKTARDLGLRYEKGKPLASRVKHLSRAEIAAIADNLTPPQRVKELPHYIY